MAPEAALQVIAALRKQDSLAMWHARRSFLSARIFVQDVHMAQAKYFS